MRKFAYLLSVAAAGSSSLAHAGGVFVGESGSQAMERGGAFVAKADDPTALSMNPAGLMKSRKIEIYVGANLMDMNLTFQRSGTYPNQPTEPSQPPYVGQPFGKVENGESFQPVPYLAASERWKNVAFGEGFFANNAVPSRDFACQNEQFCQVDANGAPLATRYDVVNQKVLAGFPSLAIAARVLPSLDLGVRASWGFASIKARNFPWALPNKQEDPTREGDFNADVTDSFVPAFGAGVLFRPTSFLEFGAAYSSSMSVHAKGTGDARLGPNSGLIPGQQVFIVPKDDEVALCAKGGKTSSLKTCIDFNLPQTLTGGGRFIVRDKNGGERADIELDVRWENWKNASDDLITVDGKDSLGVFSRGLIPVLNRHGFKDVVAVRLGGAYKIDLSDNSLTLRAGGSYDTAAAPDSWTRVDKDGRPRTTLAGGAAFETGRFRFDAGFAVVVESSVTVTDIANPTPTFENRVQPDPLQPSLDERDQQWHPINAGTYDSGYIVGMLGVTAAF